MTSQPPYAQTVIPCDCGSTEAYWHGPEDGTRAYGCDACWRRRQLAALTPDDVQTIAHALDVAAQRFAENAAAMREEAARLRIAIRETPPLVSPATECERLAKQFDRQATDCRKLYPRFADL